ncbi:hypothetical protein NM688_g4015 [Phlebia brevispora]|uniref:Uncharacterized protein n=1 Tax=Phlebia brevispora TaxID=194682 RepID=A0ACC1T439_9APHY|nr:hypothetical protein NM688_g4015 [Phlebia brevispora]
MMVHLAHSEVLELEPLLVFEKGHCSNQEMSLPSEGHDYTDGKEIEKVDYHPVLASESSTEPSVKERQLVRKFDSRILSTLCIIYLFAYLDRSNLGNARLQGLPQDTLGGDPTGKLFDWVNSAFYFSYSTGFDFAGLLVARVSLGVFEAAFAPGIPIYLSLWYTKHELGLRLAYFFGFAAVAGAFGGLIAFGIQQASTSIANWRLLFLVEGVPTIALGVIALFLLPDRPEETSYLSGEERLLQLERMNRGITADVGRSLNKEHIKRAFKDWRVYATGVIFFGANCALASISAFLPTIIKTFGFTNARAQLLTVPPYAVSAVVMGLTSYASDRLQNRGLCIAFSATLGAIGYVLLLVVANNDHVRYFATFCIVSGTYTVIGVVIAWFAHNLGSESKKAAGIPLYMSIGQCGSVLGSHIFPATEGPRYIKGFAVSCALEFLAAIMAIILHISYRIDNAARDRKYGKVHDTEATVETRELADQTCFLPELVTISSDLIRFEPDRLRYGHVHSLIKKARAASRRGPHRARPEIPFSLRACETSGWRPSISRASVGASIVSKNATSGFRSAYLRPCTQTELDAVQQMENLQRYLELELAIRLIVCIAESRDVLRAFLEKRWRSIRLVYALGEFGCLKSEPLWASSERDHYGQPHNLHLPSLLSSSQKN